MPIPLIATIEGTVELSLLLLTAIILIGPLFAERFRIPGLVGLILGGMIVGPFMLGWEQLGGLIGALGSIGILYLMFLAGVSFNLKTFAANRSAAIVYGLIGFFIPFLLSVGVAMGFLGYSLLAAMLIGAMWASNTLVAYPEARAAGLADNGAVGTAVSAGVIADVLSLTVLAIVSSTAVIEAEEPSLTATTEDPTLPLWLGIAVLVLFTQGVLPRVARWFFVSVGHTRTQRFVFVLAGMAAGSVVALLGGMEGLIGAFLAGLGMNRLIPSRGPLMQRIDFFGEALIIPAFLVSIGLSIDPSALFDLATLRLAAVFTILVVVGKVTASAIAGSVFGFSFAETGLMAALSVGQAASTLAIAQVGFSLGLFDQTIVNAAVLTVVATAFITSYGTLFFAARVERPEISTVPLGSGVLVDTRASGVELEGLMRLAGAIAGPDDGLVLPYAVARSGERALATASVERATEVAERLGLDLEAEVRLDDSFADATLSLVEEKDASLLMLTWAGPRFPNDYVFGNDIDLVGQRSDVPTIAAHVVAPWERLVVVTGSFNNAWRKADVELMFAAARRIHRSYPVPSVILTPTPDDLGAVVGTIREAEVIRYAMGSGTVIDTLLPSDLLLVTPQAARKASSLNHWRLARSLQKVSVAVVAGPGRLTVSAGLSRQQVHGMVGVTD